MLKLFSKQSGAVTVFLVIILVPTITVCSMFVDASRMELAKPVVESAGNLALNTMLTEYDEQLNEIYGLLGSCQDTEDLKETVKQYFVESLKSQGIGNAETEEIVGKLDQAFDENIADLLDINAANVEISPVENGNLANPALEKQQIVEFMKYRAPVDLSSRLISMIKDVVEKSKTAKQETKVTEEKQDYYEAENELLEMLKKLYDELREFRKLNLNQNYINDQVVPDITKNFKADYRKIHTKMVFDLCNTDGSSTFEPEKFRYKVSEYNDSDFGEDKKFDSDNKATTSDVQGRANKFLDSISTYIQKKKSAQDTIWNYYTFDNTIYKTQYWTKSVELINANINIYNGYIRAAKEMCRQYWLFNNACENTNQTATINIRHDVDINKYVKDGQFAGDKTISFSINKNENQSLANIYIGLTKDFKESGFYGSTAKLLNQISKEAVQGKSTLDIGTAGTNGQIGTISTTATNEKIYDICSKYKEYYYKFQKADDHLKKAQKCMKKIGDSNSGLIKKTVDAYEDWKKQSAKLDDKSSMKADNEKDLEEEKKLIEENLTDESLKELSNRIDNVKALIKTIDDNINSTKYHNTQLKDIDSIEIAKSKAGIKNDKISHIYSELKNYAEQTFKFSTGNREVNVKNSNHPDIVAVNEPKLHKWMRKKFKDNNSKKSEDDAKDEYKDYKKKSEDDSYEDDEVGKTSNEIKNQENLPSKGGGSEKKEKTAQISKVTSFLTNLFSDGILDSLENLGKSFRDDLYTTDYVMNMFSYDTFVNEGKKKYTEDTNSTISTENFEKNKDKTFGYNKTLTNMPINKDNNFAYQGEVEYILYGNYNAINKANSYGRIFLLRYAFNVAPVFQKFWKDDAVRVAAHGISLATYGVIPESLVKIAICLMLNVGETVEDIIVLRSGEGVKLVKSKDEVSIQFPSKKKKNTSSSKNDFKPRYSDYISLFLFLKLASSSENEIYKRIADVVQVNMAKITKKKSFVLEKAVVYYQIKSDISIPPLMLNLQINKGESAYNLNTLCDYEYKNIAGY